MARILGLMIFALLAVLSLYLSRYWVFELWGREGLAGFEVLRAQGDLLARWLRGTMAAPFALIIWGIAVFLALTFVQWIWGLLARN